MTISSTTNRVYYAGNGSTQGFAYPYYFQDDGDVKIIKRNNGTGSETTLTNLTDYTITGEGLSAGGTATLGTAPSSSETLIIFGDPALTQSLDLADLGDFDAESVEAAFDKQVRIAQRLKERMDRTIRLSDADNSTATLVLPLLADRTSQYLKFDASGNITTALAVDATVTATAYMQTVLDDTNASQALVTLGHSPYFTTVVDETNASNALVALGVSPFNVAALDETNASNTQVALGISAYMTTVLDDANSTAARLTLGFDGTNSVLATGSPSPGYGSSATKIRRFTTVTTTGTAVTCTQDATNGDIFTINATGIYAVHYTDKAAGGGEQIGISVDSTQNTTAFFSITAANQLEGVQSDTALNAQASYIGRLTAGQVLRAHSNGGCDSVNAKFRITKLF